VEMDCIGLGDKFCVTGLYSFGCKLCVTGLYKFGGQIVWN
jgi:hypothetical protein